jgi:hypothetical protein
VVISGPDGIKQHIEMEHTHLIEPQINAAMILAYHSVELIKDPNFYSEAIHFVSYFSGSW